jgi:hypothetical protein
MPLRRFSLHISKYIYDELTLDSLANDDPPTWCEKIDHALELEPKRDPAGGPGVDPNPMYKNFYVRVFNRRGVILVQFEVDYFEATKGWEFDEEDDKENKKKNDNNNEELLSQINESNTFQPSNSRTIVPTAVSDSKEEIRQLIKIENEESKRKIADSEKKIAAQEEEMKDLRSLLQSLLGSSPPANQQQNRNVMNSSFLNSPPATNIKKQEINNSSSIRVPVETSYRRSDPTVFDDSDLDDEL